MALNSVSMRLKLTSSLIFFTPFVLVVIGCGGKGVVPVSAIITLDGSPLAEASVTFIRSGQEEGRAAFGLTDDSGIAQLTTYEPFDGALPGNYTVVILKSPKDPHTYEYTEIKEGDVQEMMKRSSGAGHVSQQRRVRVRTTIPEVYSRVNSTPLSCEVASGTDEYTFELQSAAGK